MSTSSINGPTTTQRIARELTTDQYDRVMLTLDRIKHQIGIAKFVVESLQESRNRIIFALAKFKLPSSEWQALMGPDTDDADLPELLSFTITDLADVAQVLDENEKRHD